MRQYTLIATALISMLSSIAQTQAQVSPREVGKQKKDLREFIRYQGHYQEQLAKFQDEILQQDESLQFLYSQSIDSETLYLEATEAYEKLEAQKLVALPEAQEAQDAVIELQKALRQAGKPREYYTIQIQKLSAAKRHLANLRDSLKEDEEVKLAFDAVDALEKKYLTDARNFEDLMAKAMSKHPKALITKQFLDACSQIIQLLQRIVIDQDRALMPELVKRWEFIIQLLRSKGTDQEKLFLAQLEKRLVEIKRGRNQR